MKKNMGINDRVGRVSFAVVVVLLWMMDMISGSFATVLLVLGAVFTLTSLIGFCPLYTVFGVNTNKPGR